MRTTLTLSEDVAVRLESLRAERHISLKEAVDQVLRAGLGVIDKPGPLAAKPRTTRPINLGRRLVPDIDNVAEALGIAEGEDFR